MKYIYLDNAATTPIRDEARRAMSACERDSFANPSSMHPLGRMAHDRLEGARETLAAAVGCKPNQLVFTSGGTESNNLAVLGVAAGGNLADKHVLVSAIEHKSVLEAANRLHELGASVEYLRPDSSGIVSADLVRSRVQANTVLVSVMLVNNEIGTCQPVDQIGEFLRARGIIFHVDAVQALGKVPLDLSRRSIDLATFAAHKIEGPRGIAALFVGKGVNLSAQLLGGPQERGFRAGTENVAGAVGFAEAARLAVSEQKETSEKLYRLRAGFEDRVLSSLNGHVAINGSSATRAPHISSVLFRHVDSNYLIRRLADFGICATSGSACQSTSLAPSHVLLALGLPNDLAQSAVRFSLSRLTTVEELDYTADCLRAIHKDLGLVSDKEMERKDLEIKLWPSTV
jgi:cysteine desulfurase